MPAIPVIGMGAVCSAGYGVNKGFAAIAQGRDCLTPLSVVDSGLKQIPLCGQVPEKPEIRLGMKAPHPTAGFALWAAMEALLDVPDRRGLRLGVVLATTVAGLTRSEQFYRQLRDSPDHIRHAWVNLAHHEPTTVSGTVARHVGAAGFHTLSTACSTGVHAIGIAKRLIERNAYDLCLAVGTDALSLLTVRGFASLMLIDYAGCKPFDRRRIGISLGEGAGALLLASPAAAKRIGSEPSAYVAGWGASADCHHMTAPHPEGRGARLAVEKALAESKVPARDISLISAHGTATPDNDVSEIKAMREVFGELPPFCSMKRTLGHTLAASGALEAVFSVCAMRKDVIPSTAGFEEPDDAIGAAPSPGGGAELRHVLKNSFGFGGNNAAVVLSRPEGF
jgi:3-oxoacyl-(acyl-carrier-protein) synthase